MIAVDDYELVDLYAMGLLNRERAREVILMRLSDIEGRRACLKSTSEPYSKNTLAFKAFRAGIITKEDMVAYFEIEDAELQTT